MGQRGERFPAPRKVSKSLENCTRTCRQQSLKHLPESSSCLAYMRYLSRRPTLGVAGTLLALGAVVLAHGDYDHAILS